MTTEQSVLEVHGQEVDVVRKRIKNLHISVYPPDGRVRVACPLHIDDEAVRLAVIRRLGWIRRQQRGIRGQERVSPREYVTGESLYHGGRRYRLRVREGSPAGVEVASARSIVLTVRNPRSRTARATVLEGWQRQELHQEVSAIIAHWEPILGVSVREWVIQKMTRKWGSCNSANGRIRFNLALVHLPRKCVEYVVVHELMHLFERTHGARFQTLMDRYLPQWRARKAELSDTPLSIYEKR